MSDSSKGWDLATADTWLKDRPDGSGDPETRRACEQIIAEARKHRAGPTQGNPPIERRLKLDRLFARSSGPADARAQNANNL